MINLVWTVIVFIYILSQSHLVTPPSHSPTLSNIVHSQTLSQQDFNYSVLDMVISQERGGILGDITGERRPPRPLDKVISQERGGLLIWDVGEAAAHQPPVPGVQGGPHAVAALVAQLLLALDPVHHVEAVTA